jgi:hypothetical protein
VRGAPRDLLHAHAHAGVRALELRHELLDQLALAAHGPEVDRGRTAVVARVAAPGAGEHQAGEKEDRTREAHRRAHLS